MAVFNEPSQWDTSLVVNGDTNVIPQSTPAGSGALSFDDGFPQITQVPLGAGGIAPDRKDFNAVMKLLGDAVFYMQNGGFWSYNPLFDYAVGRVVLYTDGYLYLCIQTNGASSTVVAPDDVNGDQYWLRIPTMGDLAGIRVLTGTSIEWTSDYLPTGYLFQNGAEYDNGDYTDLFNVIGYRYGSTTAVKASGSLGEAFIAGANGNNIRVTVALSGANYIVSTYYNGNLVGTQSVTSASELKCDGYVVFDTNAVLSDGTDETFTGGVDGTSFKVPDRRNRYGIGAGTNPVGLYIGEQLPNIKGRTGAGRLVGDIPVGTETPPFTATYKGGNNLLGGGNINLYNYYIDMDLSTANSVYTDSGKVYPSSIALNFIIKT